MSIIPPANTPGPCPSSAEWQAALWGRTTNERWLEIENHLLGCSKCENTVDALTEQSDTVVRSLCQGPVTAEDEPVYQSLYEKLLSAEALSGDVDLAVSVPSLPFQLGNYELLEPLGHGANGSVYRARHVPLDRLVAVKLLRPDQDFDPSGVDRFLQEMRAVGSLDHPHIVRATDAGETEGQHYLVMEYVPGIDLSTVISTHGSLRPNDACEVLRQAALGLRCLHEHGFVHRDVKPSNLLLTANGQIKLLDLGLVQSVRQETVDETSQGKIPHGTADYMPPEQWRAFGRVEFRSDLYSLGCTLAKLLTSVPPFRPLPPGFATKFAAHCGAPIPTLRMLRADVPDAVQKTFERLLAKQPEKRFGSAGELARHLRHLSRGADLRSLAKACGQEPSTDVGAAESNPQWTRRQSLSVAAVVAASALLGVPLLRKLSRQTGARSFVRRNDWRALSLASPAFLIPETDQLTPTLDDALCRRVGEDAFEIRSSKLLLLNLGQPVVANFRLAIDVVTPVGHNNAGLFFKYARVEEGDQLAHKFQTLELVRNRQSGDEPSGEGKLAGDRFRLLWSRMRVVQRGGIIKEDRTLLAEVFIPTPKDAQPHTLEVGLGSRGFPDVRWDGKTMENWKPSTAGNRQATLPNARLRTEFLGYVGLIAGEPDTRKGQVPEQFSPGENAPSSTQFRRPRLLYEDGSTGRQGNA